MTNLPSTTMQVNLSPSAEHGDTSSSLTIIFVQVLSILVGLGSKKQIGIIYVLFFTIGKRALECLKNKIL